MNKRYYGDGRSIIEILNIGFEPLLTEEEWVIYKRIGEINKILYGLKKKLSFFKYKFLYLDEEDFYYVWLYNIYKDFNLEHNIYTLETELNQKKEEFKKLLNNNISTIREINEIREFRDEEQFRKIAIFESDLTRTFNCKDMEYSKDIVSVVTYYTEIFESIIKNGFNYNNIHFVFYTAGAGQTRNKKSTFVNEDLLNENIGKLMCGLTWDKINELGGMNTNKFLAYTSLSQTNSSVWDNFDIDRAIVVDDVEFVIPNQKVRHIYTETPEDKLKISELEEKIEILSIELKKIKQLKKSYEKGFRRDKEEIIQEKYLIKKRKELESEISDIKDKFHKTSIKLMDVTIPFTDGFGITFKRNPNAMVRAPFIKGLISFVPRKMFKDFCKDKKYKINKVVDIYGKEHSINNIDYIFTKSQFKMYKYYENVLNEKEEVIKTGWEVYCENFKKYNCQMCRCNVEKRVKLNAKTNYQVLQTLTTEMTDIDIKSLASYDIDNLNGIGNDVQCMLNILGANEEKNDKMNYFQKSLLLYPEMLKDFHVRSTLKNTKNSMIKKFKSGRFSINGAYTFIIPEPLACLQWWFTNERDLSKLGLIKQGQIYCNLFKNEEEVDCLRSPHLDHAHCIRINTINDDLKSWYKTNGLYVGVNDIMSKLLMFDNDGDTCLVHNNKTIIKCAKSFQKKYNMIPNYYDMPKANPQIINNDNLFKGIVMAYHHGNIGTPSNEITKIFDTLSPKSSKEEILEAIEIVALRCCDVNYVIDYAKTLYKPTIPKSVQERYKKYSGRKVPKFFMYAKDKRLAQVEDITDNNINRISNVVKSNKIIFKDLLGKYSYKVLMSEDIDINTKDAEKIVQLYKQVDESNQRLLSGVDISNMDFDEKRLFYLLTEYNSEKQLQMFIDELGFSVEYITNVLVKSLKGEATKDTLWKLFGEQIYKNIQSNIQGTKICEVCGERFEYIQKVGKPRLYCDNCAYDLELEKTKKRMKKYREIN